jgi:hypothetical protein
MVKRNQQIWHESLEGDGYSINKELTKLTRRCINCFLTWFVQTQQNLLTVLINLQLVWILKLLDWILRNIKMKFQNYVCVSFTFSVSTIKSLFGLTLLIERLTRLRSFYIMVVFANYETISNIEREI